MKWSENQRVIFNTYRSEDCNIAVKAGPGSGKTTVLKQLCKLTPLSEKSIFLAFNKSIVEELKEALPSHVKVQTLHSLGCGILFREYGNIKVVQTKTFGVLRKLEKKWIEKNELEGVKSRNYYHYNISQLYEVYRMNLLTEVGPDLVSLSNRHGLDVSGNILQHLTELIKVMVKVNKGYPGKPFEIDYTDMIYLPVIKNFSIPKYDRVFIDEAQDLNLLQHELVDRTIKRSGRFISVGDERQSIYVFLGADSESFSKFATKPNTKVLPLSVTYRCPTDVVELINTVYEGVEAAPGAIKGEVRSGSIEEIEGGDMVLCRNNKPLLELYFILLKNEVPCYIRGADIGKGIVRMVKDYSTHSVTSCIESLYESLEEKERRLSESGMTFPRRHPSYVKYSEDIQLFEIVAQRYETVSQVLPVITSIFKENSNGVMLSTIHKAKGLEADNVFLLNKELIPSKYAEQAWEKEQEQRLLFVAYSRPKKELIYINV